MFLFVVTNELHWTIYDDAIESVDVAPAAGAIQFPSLDYFNLILVLVSSSSPSSNYYIIVIVIILHSSCPVVYCGQIVL